MAEHRSAFRWTQQRSAPERSDEPAAEAPEPMDAVIDNCTCPLGFPRRSVGSGVFNRAAKKRLRYLEERAGKTPGAELVPASELRVSDFVLDDTGTHQYLELKAIRKYPLPDADLVLNLGDRTTVFATLDMPFVRDRLEDIREKSEHSQEGGD